jgi:hypothetical protein
MQVKLNKMNKIRFETNIVINISNCIAYREENSLIVSNLAQETIYSFDVLKENLVSMVLERPEIKKGTKKTIEEFYCNPIKNGGTDLKINTGDIPIDSLIDIEISVLGIWFSSKSWGPYLVAKCSPEAEPLFIQDSDSDSGPDI